MEKLIDIYKHILTTMGLSIDEDGVIYHEFMGEKQVLTIKAQDSGEELTLLMPSKKLLSKPLPEGAAVFHPLSENVVRGGESEVLKKMRSIVEFQLTFYLSTLMQQIAYFAAGKGPKLNGRQTAFLKPLVNADDKFCKFVDNIIAASELTGRNRLMKFFMARGVTLGGQGVTRAAIVKFPVMNAAANETSEKVFGVKPPRKKDKQLLIELMQVILDGFGFDDEYYSRGSSSSSAPYWDALLKAYLAVSERINDVLKLFGKHLPDVLFVPPMNSKFINSEEWENDLKDMHRQRDMIPPQPYNTGMVEDIKEVEERSQAQVRAEPVKAKPKEEVGSPPWEDDPVSQTVKTSPPQEDSGVMTAPFGGQQQAPYSAYQTLSNTPASSQTAAKDDPWSIESLTQLQYQTQHGGYVPPVDYNQGGYYGSYYGYHHAQAAPVQPYPNYFR